MLWRQMRRSFAEPVPFRLIGRAGPAFPGIAPDVLPHLFHPFRQGDNSISRQFGGSGLGLAISRHLVQLHNGRIEVQSELGKGTTVTVTLLSRLGARLANMPLRKTPAGPYEIELAIGSVARGEYVFQIDASHGADQAKALLSFRVN